MAVELSKALKDIASFREKEVDRTQRPHTPRGTACLCVEWSASVLGASSPPASRCVLLCLQSAVFEQTNKEQELSHFSNGQSPAASVVRD